MPDLTSLTQWIEGHPTTVDLFKWVLVLLVAWLAGVFKYFRTLTRTPRLSVSPVTSRCYLEKQPFEEHADAVKAAFLLDVQIANRSSENVVVSSFYVRYRTRRPVKRWSEKISAVSLPNRVRHRMGAGTKFMRNWFARFPDEIEGLTVKGKIEARDAHSGFALFVSHTYGSWNPRLRKEAIPVRVTAILTSGVRVSGTVNVKVNTDPSFFEEMVPGFLDQIRHPTAWNAPLRT